MARGPRRVSKRGLVRYVHPHQRLGRMPVRRLRGDEGAVHMGTACEDLPGDCEAGRRGDCRRSGEASRRRSCCGSATASQRLSHGHRVPPCGSAVVARAEAVHFERGELACDELAEGRGGFHGGVSGIAARMGCCRSSKGCHGRRSGFVPCERSFPGGVPFLVVRPAPNPARLAAVNRARGISRLWNFGNRRR